MDGEELHAVGEGGTLSMALGVAWPFLPTRRQHGTFTLQHGEQGHGGIILALAASAHAIEVRNKIHDGVGQRYVFLEELEKELRLTVTL